MKTLSLTGIWVEIVISIGILQIIPMCTWLFSRYKAALEPKSLGEFMKVDKFDSSHRVIRVNKADSIRLAMDRSAAMAGSGVRTYR